MSEDAPTSESTERLKFTPVFCQKEQINKIHIFQYTFSDGIQKKMMNVKVTKYINYFDI